MRDAGNNLDRSERMSESNEILKEFLVESYENLDQLDR
jgi:hypothetical protein